MSENYLLFSEFHRKSILKDKRVLLINAGTSSGLTNWATNRIIIACRDFDKAKYYN